MSTARSSDCRICAIALGQYALGEVDQPWLEDDRYLAFTSIGALIEGWSLVAPRAHSLNLLRNYTDADFIGFVGRAISAVQALYGSVVIFEHGGQHEGSVTNCGTSHAHLHIVPASFSMQQEVAAFDEEMTWFRCSLKNIRELVGGQEYLFVADRYNGIETQGDVCLLQEGRSQFFRRVIAKRIGRVDESNYRTHSNLATAVAGAGALRLSTGRSKAA